jgi:hypothetical protein
VPGAERHQLAHDRLDAVRVDLAQDRAQLLVRLLRVGRPVVTARHRHRRYTR